MKLFFAALTLLLGSAIAPAAHADLIGSSVTLTARLPELSQIYESATSATVTSATTFPVGSLAGFPYSFAMTGNQITMTATSSSLWDSFDFIGFAFDFTGAPAITSAVLDTASTLVPFAISFTGSEVAVNFSGLSTTPGATTIIDVDAPTTVSPSPVPEPASLALFSTGLIGTLGAFRRRLTA